MNAKCALIKYLLAGKTVTIMTGFKELGITNVPREISRCIEQPFGAIVSRMKMEGKSRWGVDCSWYEYRLNPLITGNDEAIKKMAEYLSKNDDSSTPPAGKKVVNKPVENISVQKTASSPLYTAQTLNF